MKNIVKNISLAIIVVIVLASPTRAQQFDSLFNSQTLAKLFNLEEANQIKLLHILPILRDG
jgi:hypothetical protein